MDRTIEVGFNKIEIHYQKVSDPKKHENLIAYITLTIRGESGEHFSVSGFTLWRSKFGGYKLSEPGKKGFKYFLADKFLMRKIQNKLLDIHEYEEIEIEK